MVTVIGAGLAGSEAAWQLASRGVRVRLIEMRPVRMTPAHRTAFFGELVCSNSLRNASLTTAVGVLKEEMRRLGSLVMQAADRARVPAGGALAVDREEFARALTQALERHPMVEVVRGEATAIPDTVTVVATGPLTSPALEAELARLVGSRHLYFYDAIAPVVSAGSIDMGKAFRASRYGTSGDDGDYINCPMTHGEYEAFVTALLGAQQFAAHEFEKPLYFEGCMPIEEMARRGPMTLAFGPMKPVGLVDPRTGRRPAAVVQLRQDDRAGRLYSMVGFQTKMLHGEQRRIFRTIPGLERVEFVRLGSLHRNTFIDAPRVLAPTLQLRARPELFLAGQMTGVEGYVESAAMGLFAGLNAERLLRGRPLLTPPPETALGSLVAYISEPARRDFQPMNANFGLMPETDDRRRGVEKREALANRALGAIESWIAAAAIEPPPVAPAEASQTAADAEHWG